MIGKISVKSHWLWISLITISGLVWVAREASADSLLLGSATPIKEVNSEFRNAARWKGADGAMSLALKPGVTLWLFGDTWIKQQNSLSRIMINNSVALQTRKSGKPRWSFYFGGSSTKPTSLIRPLENGVWYWPGDGIVYGDHLFLIMKKIRKKENLDPLFQFDWFGEDLVIVQNPFDEPDKWVYTVARLSEPAHQIQYGLACMRNERFLYSLCYFQKTPDARTKATVLARIPLGKLANASAQDWQYLCQAKGRRQGSWGADLSHVESLIPDGGPEMSLFYHKPLGCFVTVYQAPLSRDVNLRVARNVAGPWSASIVIYRAPEIKLADGKSSALVYAGKAHAHLSNGESIGFTYCANPGGLEQHAANPGIYFPNALSVRVPRSTVAELLAGAEKTVPER